MAAADTIKILIEADSTGLETQLKRASDTVVRTIDKMNTQQVNWDAILAKTISPTIIASVAAVFAQSISQFMQFQNAAVNLNNIGGQATNSFAKSLSQTSGQAYTMSMQAGQSLGNTATAYEAFMKAGLTSAAAQDAVNRSSKISYSTGQDYLSVVQELVTMFNQWGVTTTPQVEKALLGLTNAANNGQFTFKELVDALTPQGQLLKAKTNISDIATSLATLSTKSGLSKTTILDTFKAISGATGQTAIMMNTMFGGAASAISKGPNGLITAFQDIAKSSKSQSALVAVNFGQQVGIMSTDIMGFRDTSIKSYAHATNAADTLRKHLVPLDTLLKHNTSDTAKLEKAWNRFQTKIESFVIPSTLSGLPGMLGEVNDLIGGGKKTGAAFKANPLQFTGNFLQALVQNMAKVGNIMTLGVAGDVGKGLGGALYNMSNPESLWPQNYNHPTPNHTTITNNTNIQVTGGADTHSIASIKGGVESALYNQSQGIGI